MNKQLAKEKITTLINEQKFQTLNHIFDFLTVFVEAEDLEELKSFSEREKDQFLKTKEENEKRVNHPRLKSKA